MGIAPLRLTPLRAAYPRLPGVPYDVPASSSAADPMRFNDVTSRLLGLSRTVHTWLGALTQLDTRRRLRVAGYADHVAETLARAAAAFTALERDPANVGAIRDAVRELGRIAGYIEDIVRALEQHLDGRKLAGVKRRLDQLAAREPILIAVRQADAQRIERLIEAEGYFRSLADGLRA